MSLSDAGLVARWYLDEAASGSSPSSAADSGPNDYDLTTVNYGSGGTAMAWTETSGNRGLVSSSSAGSQRAGRAMNNSGDAVRTALQGVTKFVIELVLNFAAGNPDYSRVININNRLGYGGRLGIYSMADGTLMVAFNGGDAPFGKLNVASSGRCVVQAVVDTTLSSDRLKWYLNGSLAVSSNPFSINETLDLPSDLDLWLMNVQTSGSYISSPVGTLYYAAIYAGTDGLFDATRADQHYDTLIADDDVPSGGDTTPPTISGVTLVATGPTTLQWQVTTNEAGPAWAVLYPAAKAAPSAAQIKAGLDVDNVAAVDALGPQSFVFGANNLNFTGASPSTAYKASAVQDDEVTPTPNTSTVLTSNSATTDASVSPPVTNVTSTEVSGQSVTVEGTYTGGTPTSGLIFIPAAAVPNGAVDVGPAPLDSISGGNFSVTLDDLVPGSYDPPEITLSNSGGDDTDEGTAFEILGIDGDPDSPINTEQPETVAIADSPSSQLGQPFGNQSDSVSGADSSSATVAASSTRAETAGAAETTGASLTAQSAQAETAGAADAPSASITATVTRAETVSGADTQTGQITTVVGTQAETSALAESQASAVSSVPVMLESVGAVDGSLSTKAMLSAQAETQAAADSQSLGPRDTLATQSEAMSGVDAPSTFIMAGVLVGESAAALESVTGELGVIVGLQVEALVVTDAQLAQLQLAGAIEEQVSAEEEQVAMVLTGTTVVETMSVADVVALLRYPYPTRRGNYPVRRFIIRYR